MKKLIVQMIKFGIIGVIAFCIDYGLFLLLLNVFGVHYLIASIVGFVVSVIFNFIASMRHVFAGREGQTRTEQFVIFVILSVIGLGLNSLFIWLSVDIMHMWPEIGKIVATILVMIFNFITRKYFLEDHDNIKQAPVIKKKKTD